MKRTRRQVVWDFVQSWRRKAEGDLLAAERLLEVQQGDYFAVAFHSQQAAEKFLKAFLVRFQILFPKTHNIEQLLQLATPSAPSLEEELVSAVILTPYGVEFRYPGEEIADLDTARQAPEEARRVKTAILARLKDYLSQGRPSAPDS